MRTYKTVRGLRNRIEPLIEKGKTIGFVPTMGALHEGHLSLVQRCVEETDHSICSVFVNPTQFNETSDLDQYPRTLQEDQKLLRKASLDYLFAPTVKQVYPNGMLKQGVELDFGKLDKVMEGQFRPGHFEGMAQVVKRLLDITTPTKLYMGQKDFQQFTIVAHMIKELKIDTQLIVCPIVREKDGLAMSSRNRRLLPKHRKKAHKIYETLLMIRERAKDVSIQKMINTSIARLTFPGFKPEYISIVDGNTLEEVKNMDRHDYVVVCAAVWAGNIRLIDNIILKQ